MSAYDYRSPQEITSSGKYPFTMGQLRHLLLRRHRNGLATAVRKVGKRLVIRVDLFQKWIEEQTER